MVRNASHQQRSRDHFPVAYARLRHVPHPGRPPLIIYGGTDDLLTFRDQEILADRIPGAILKVYPDAGHLVLWEHPARVAADVAAFLRALA